MPNPFRYRGPRRAALNDAPRPSPHWHWHSRGVLLVAIILLSLGGVALYAGAAWMVVCYRLLTDGGILLIWLGSAMGLGYFLLKSTRLWERAAPVALKCACAAAMGLGTFSLAILGLGLAGKLSAISAWVMLAFGWAGGFFVLLLTGRNNRFRALLEFLEQPVRWDWLWILATPFLSMAVIAAMAPPGMLWNPQEPHGYDVVEYHLQVPREWYEAGRILPLHHNAFSYFPFNVEMHYLLAMHLRGGPWAGMYLAQLMHVAFMSLAVLAVYGLARCIASPKQAVISALALLTVPWLTQLAGIAYDEGGLLLFGVLAGGLSLRTITNSEGRLPRFALAGLMAGFAAGTKLTGVPEVIVAAPLMILLMSLARAIARLLVPSSSYAGGRLRERGDSSGERHSPPGPSPQPSPLSTVARERGRAIQSVWLGIIVFSALSVAAYSPWMLRNIAWANNPVFPEMMPLLGKSDFNSRQVQRWDMAHKAPLAEQPIVARLGKFWREIVLGWQFGFVLLPLACGAFVFSLRRPGASYLAGYLALLAYFWLFFTHLQGRFLLLAAPMAALLLAQCNWRRAAPAIAIAVVVALCIAWWGIHKRLTVRLNEVNNEQVRALGVTDLSELFLSHIAPDGLPPGVRIVLVGDARAFWYPIPMSRLSYRTVFDVKGGSPDFLTAWSGPEADAPGAWIVVDPSEIRRFLRTYQGLPAVPEDVLQREQAYVIKR